MAASVFFSCLCYSSVSESFMAPDEEVPLHFQDEPIKGEG